MIKQGFQTPRCHVMKKNVALWPSKTHILCPRTAFWQIRLFIFGCLLISKLYEGRIDRKAHLRDNFNFYHFELVSNFSMEIGKLESTLVTEVRGFTPGCIGRRF
jgi:hypothetical protein